MIDVSEAGQHVADSTSFHVPQVLWDYLPVAIRGEHPGSIPLPYFGTVELFGHQVELQLTKFMVLEAVAALLMLAIFIPLARRIATGDSPRGRWWNFFEVILVFVRDEMARPAIGGHGADRFLPFLWNVFFFILFCNLLGLIPWAGSPTGSLSVTAVLAVMTFATVAGAGMKQFGAIGFFKGLVPHMDLPKPLAIMLVPMIFAIEVLGLMIRHLILAVRLLANMFAGHLVVAVVVGFIGASATTWAWYGVMPASVLGAVALNLLELFVAFLQAYIFTFLSALFIGMAVHQH
jgi:F-type H+-transporting ATPase subunit a